MVYPQRVSFKWNYYETIPNLDTFENVDLKFKGGFSIGSWSQNVVLKFFWRQTARKVWLKVQV